MKVSTIIILLLAFCSMASIAGFYFGYEEGNKEVMSKNRIQAEHFCQAVNRSLGHIAYQTKSKIWSIQCK